MRWLAGPIRKKSYFKGIVDIVMSIAVFFAGAITFQFISDLAGIVLFLCGIYILINGIITCHTLRACSKIPAESLRECEMKFAYFSDGAVLEFEPPAEKKRPYL